MTNKNNSNITKININLEEIARLDGFPIPRSEIKCESNLVQYKNEKGLVRTYDANTGKQIGKDYVPKHDKTIKFNTPLEYSSSTLGPIMDTSYVRSKSKEYSR